MAKLRKQHEYIGDEKQLIEKDAIGAPVKDINWTAREVETESESYLEEDTGEGNPVVIRMFEFGMNPEAFKQANPTTQDIFNSHYKGIEVALWKDGLKVVPEVNPRIVLTPEKGIYRIFVTARAARGHLLTDVPNTLGTVLHGR